MDLEAGINPALLLMEEKNLKALVHFTIAAAALSITSCSDRSAPAEKSLPQVGATSVPAETLKAASDRSINQSSERVDDTAGSLQSSGQDRPRAPGRFLRHERRLVRGDGMSVEGVEQTLMSRDFARTVQEFEREIASDPEARNITELYKIAMQEKLGTAGVLTQLACGLSICIGEVRTRDQASYDSWLDQFFADARTPSYSYAASPKDLGKAGIETRFAFSTDPGLKAVVATPPRPGS